MPEIEKKNVWKKLNKNIFFFNLSWKHRRELSCVKRDLLEVEVLGHKVLIVELFFLG